MHFNMIYRLIFLLLLTSNTLLGQTSQLLPSEVLSKKQLLDSLGFEFKDLKPQLLACGQFNQQAAATLIGNSGLVLVPRAAVLGYIPVGIDPAKGFWAKQLDEERALTSGFITFELEQTNVSKEIFKGVKPSDTEQERSRQIVRNQVTLKAQTRTSLGQNLSIKSLNQAQEYYLYRSAIYADIRLVGLPADQDQQSFALLRIQDFNTDLIPAALPMNLESISNSAYKAVIVDFPINSQFNSSSYELILEQIQNEIAKDIDSKILKVYQDLDLETPQVIVDRYENGKAVNAYFQAQELLAQKQTLERSLLLDPASKKSLDQLKDSFQQLESIFALKTYSALAFKNMITYQLAVVLNRNLKLSPDQFEQRRTVLDQSLAFWLKNWNPVLEQRLFAPMAESYFSRTKAKYLSPYLIDQIKVTNKSYTDLAELLYSNSILMRPNDLKKLLDQDLNTIKKTLQQDLAFQFLNRLNDDFTQKLNPLFNQKKTIFEINTRKFARASRNYSKGRWVNESNGTQRVHFTKIAAPSKDTLLTKIPGLPNTDMAPVLNVAGQLIGFRPEDKKLSMAYSWTGSKQLANKHSIISSSSILDYLIQEKVANYILEEIKKAP